MTHLRQSAVVLFVIALVVSAAPAFAQVDLYASSHPFALPTATTTRLFGMGGFATCIPDAGFANPAFAGILTESSFVIRRSTTNFDSGLKLTGEQVSLAVPLKSDRRGVQITGFRLTTDDAVQMPVFSPGAELTMSEYDVAVHYGQRVGSRWSVGIGVSPTMHNTVHVEIPGGPTLGHLRSSADRGCRLGAAYQMSNDGWFGLVYDRYKEDVTASGPIMGPTPFDTRFTSEEIIAGLSYRLHPALLAAVEWQQLTTEGPTSKQGDAGFRAGVEATLGNNVMLRFGSNDGALSLGLGLDRERWNANYAYVQNWNGDVTKSTLGDSDTHQFELSYRF